MFVEMSIEKPLKAYILGLGKWIILLGLYGGFLSWIGPKYKTSYLDIDYHIL